MFKIRKSMLIFLAAILLFSQFSLSSCGNLANNSKKAAKTVKKIDPKDLDKFYSTLNSDYPILQVGDIVFFSDNTGIWKAKDGKKTKISNNTTSDLASDGNTVIYTKEIEYSDEDEVAEDEDRYEIRWMTADGKGDSCLTKCTDYPCPVSADKEGYYYSSGSSLFYLDYKNEDSGISIGRDSESFYGDGIIFNNDYYYFEEDENNVLSLCCCKDVFDLSDSLEEDIEEQCKELYKHKEHNINEMNKLFNDEKNVYYFTFVDNELFSLDDSYFAIYKVNTDKNKLDLIKKEKINDDKYVTAKCVKDGIFYYTITVKDSNENTTYAASMNDTKEIKKIKDNEEAFANKDGVVFNSNTNPTLYDGKTFKAICGIDAENEKIEYFDGKYFYCSSKDKNEMNILSADFSDAPECIPKTVKEINQKVNNYLYYGKEYKYTVGSGAKKKNCSLKFLQLSIDSDDAERINAEFQSVYCDLINKQKNDLNGTSIRSELSYYKNGDVLSVILDCSFSQEYRSYKVININVKTGKQIKNKEIISMSTISESEAQSQIKENMEQEYEKRKGNTDIDKAKKYSLDPVNLNRAQYYFNKDGKLTAYYYFHTAAGSGNGYNTCVTSGEISQ